MKQRMQLTTIRITPMTGDISEALAMKQRMQLEELVKGLNGTRTYMYVQVPVRTLWQKA